MARRGAGKPAAVHFRLGEREFWVVSAVEAYRAIAGSWPQAGDVLWELGAATGVATVLAAEAASEVYAVEKAPEKLKKLQAATVGQPNVHVLDADVTAERLSIPADSYADWLLVDLGGDSPPWRTMVIADRWAAALNCTQAVVRNSALMELVTSAQPVESLTGKPAAEEARSPLEPPLKVQQTSTAVLRQRVLETSSADVATRLVEALEKSGFRERKRLVPAIVSLGPTALNPLARLVSDRSASLAARRSAADALRQVVETAEQAQADLLRGASIPVQWAVARARVRKRPPMEGTGADLIRAEQQGKSAPGGPLLQMLTDADEFVRFIARSHLRQGGEEAAESLVAGIAEGKPTLPAVVAALDALAARGRLSAERIVRWMLEAAAPGRRSDVSRAIACACLGAADQKWALSLLSALGDAPAGGRALPAEQLNALHRAAQREASAAELRRLVSEIVAAGIGADDVVAAAATSPHPWMRRVGEIVSAGTSP